MARAHTRLTHRPDHRDDLAAEALLGALPELPTHAPILIVGDRTGEVEDELRLRGHAVQAWRRLASGVQSASAWPDGEGFAAAVVRLPKGREAFAFALHGAVSVVEPGGPIFVFGANDEGIKPAAKRMRPLLETVETIDARRHCRVIRGVRPAAPEGLLGTIAAHRREEELTLGDERYTYVCYPGLFAKGRVDPASQKLLEAMPALEKSARVLDFGSGAGLLSMVLARQEPTATFQLIDADAVAIVAAKENVKGALAICGDSWSRLPSYRRYDRIVSNPPIHTGKGRDYSVVTRLVEGAEPRLLPGGTLWMVVQRQIPIRPMLEAAFDDVSVAAEDSRFRVWRCGRLSDRYGL
jgi:16S rRNA (guanine1207-N2)-methyltransferase